MKQLKAIILSIVIAASVFGPVYKAEALFGAGDTVIVVADIPQQILEAIKVSLQSAFAQYASQYLSSLISKIEENYKIANFLYYSDALVSGQYLQDYLDKYVTDPVDQRIVLNLIPQLSCGKNVDLTNDYKQRAEDYLGFDPRNLSSDDPDFSAKLARMGNFLSSPAGWDVYYRDLATQAQQAAEKAAQNEINSPGLKVAREEGTGIASSLSSIMDAQKAAIQASLDLGTANSDKLISRLASSLTYSFLTKFAFKGAVFKEQATCLQGAQLQPIIAADNPKYNDAAGQSGSFTADPTEVQPGDTVKLTWDVTGTSDIKQVILSPSGKTVPSKGTEFVTVNGDTNFSLTVLNKDDNVLATFNASVYTEGPRGN